MKRSRRPLSWLKQRLLPNGSRPWKILLGPAKGIYMEVDLQHRTQLVLGLAEREVHEWLTKSVVDIHSAIDVGAAEGAYSLYFLMRTPIKQLFSFEPSGAERMRLARNLELNGLTNDRRLHLSPDPVGDGSQTVALDTLAPELDTPCLVKIDVDGGEADVLRGSTELLHRTDVSWLIEVHSRELENECRVQLERAGLHVETIHRAWWRALMPELRPIGLNHWLIARKP
jgi:hypothetical protein